MFEGADEFLHRRPSHCRGPVVGSVDKEKLEMSIKTATPYLILGGRAAEAISFYQGALDASVKSIQRFGDVQESCPEALKDLVMHAELQAGSATLLLSDGGPDSKPVPGGAVNVALQFDSEAHARESFDALAEGGKVVEALFHAPWGGLFGVVVDRFDVSWLFTSPAS